MRRRAILASIAVLPTVGCLDAGSPGNNQETTTESPTETTTRTTTEQTTPDEPEFPTTFEQLGIECASSESGSAMVTFDASSVTISGTAIGADLCWRARLDRVTYDESAETLTVVIETHLPPDEDTACAQCLAGIDYAVTVDTSAATPESVAVIHARNGNETTITTASR